MICLTADVHHRSLKINEQLFLERQGKPVTEVALCADYLRLCAKYCVKCTLYVTGRTLAEEWEAFRPIAQSPLVEIGGHTYSGLPRRRLSRWWAGLTGGVGLSHSHSHGSCATQRRDAENMVAIARQRLGRDIVSWRSHGLVRDANTYGILAALGIQFISDELSWVKLKPERLPSGLISHPINVIEDHDHIYHAHRTRDYVARQRENWPFQDDPTSESYSIEQWGEIVERQVRAIEEQGGVATILMHPLCMYVADEFKTMERLLQVFAEYQSVWARELEPFALTTHPKESA